MGSRANCLILEADGTTGTRSSDAKVRNAARAVELAERACHATKHLDPQILHTLAAVCAQPERFEDAVTTATTALRPVRSQLPDQLAADIRQRIDQYATARPFRDQRAIGEPVS